MFAQNLESIFAQDYSQELCIHAQCPYCLVLADLPYWGGH